MRLIFILLFLISCGSRKDGIITIRSVQGINDASALEGGVVIIGTDGIAKVSRTFENGTSFVDSEFIVPGDREWEFKVFSWEGDGGSSGPNQNFKGTIRCGFVRGFVAGGETIDIPVPLTNSSCFEDVIAPPSNGGDSYFNQIGAFKFFNPVKLIGCKSSDFDISTGSVNFPSSACFSTPAFGVSGSYRVVIVGKGQGEAGIGLPRLVSACIVQDTVTVPNNGAVLADLNLPMGYHIHPENLLLPLDLEVVIEAFVDNSCMAPSLKVLRLGNGFSDQAQQFFEPGNQQLRTVIDATTNYVNLVFEDDTTGEIPTISIGATNAHNNYLNINNNNNFDISGSCFPDNSQVNLWHNNNGTWNSYSNIATCSAGSFSATNLTLSTTLSIGNEFDNTDTAYNTFEVEIVHIANGNTASESFVLGRDTVAPTDPTLSPISGACNPGSGTHTVSVGFSEEVEAILPADFIDNGSTVSFGGVSITPSTGFHTNYTVTPVYTGSGSLNIELRPALAIYVDEAGNNSTASITAFSCTEVQ